MKWLDSIMKVFVPSRVGSKALAPSSAIAPAICLLFSLLVVRERAHLF
jgi:hypothetical protein